MKPLVRWTLGPVVDAGFDVLEVSIKNWRAVYGDFFEMAICHNGLNADQVNRLKKNEVQLINQNDHINSLKRKPLDSAWKFYPPRLSLDAHEIFIDNDLVVYKRSPSIDRFLSYDDCFVVTSAYKRFYGAYKHMVPRWLAINSGLFGLPPQYDFAADMNRVFELYPSSGWKNHCDDEGVLAFLLSKKSNLLVIPMEEIRVCNSEIDFAPYLLGVCGTHFVTMNRGNLEFWERFNA